MIRTFFLLRHSICRGPIRPDTAIQRVQKHFRLPRARLASVSEPQSPPACRSSNSCDTKACSQAATRKHPRVGLDLRSTVRRTALSMTSKARATAERVTVEPVNMCTRPIVGHMCFAAHAMRVREVTCQRHSTQSDAVSSADPSMGVLPLDSLTAGAFNRTDTKSCLDLVDDVAVSQSWAAGASADYAC
jgi:hypothetical protein